eukprot:5655640-Ditylum_brightwellii.AAC.1
MREFSKGHVLKINKRLYGQAVAPKMWYDKLRADIEKRGFSACKNFADINDVPQSFRDNKYKYNWEMKKGSSVEEFV